MKTVVWLLVFLSLVAVASAYGNLPEKYCLDYYGKVNASSYCYSMLTDRGLKGYGCIAEPFPEELKSEACTGGRGEFPCRIRYDCAADAGRSCIFGYMPFGNSCKREGLKEAFEYPQNSHEPCGNSGAIMIASTGNIYPDYCCAYNITFSDEGEKTFSLGEYWWNFVCNYTLNIHSLDARADPGTAWINVYNNNSLTGDMLLKEGDVYSYVEDEFRGSPKVLIFRFTVGNVFAGSTSEVVQLKNIQFNTWAEEKCKPEPELLELGGWARIIGIIQFWFINIFSMVSEEPREKAVVELEEQPAEENEAAEEQPAGVAVIKQNLTEEVLAEEVGTEGQQAPGEISQITAEPVEPEPQTEPEIIKTLEEYAKENVLSSSGTALDTGIDLKEGDTIEIKVAGGDTWDIGANPHEQSTFFGSVTADGLGDYPVSPGTGVTFPYGALVGSIGDGMNWFLIGTDLKKTMTQPGRLYLLCWDDVPDDNSGYLTAEVGVNSRE